MARELRRRRLVRQTEFLASMLKVIDSVHNQLRNANLTQRHRIVFFEAAPQMRWCVCLFLSTLHGGTRSPSVGFAEKGLVGSAAESLQ